MKRKMMVALLCVALVAVVFASGALEYSTSYGAGISTGGTYYTSYITGMTGMLRNHKDKSGSCINNNTGINTSKSSTAIGTSPSFTSYTKLVYNGVHTSLQIQPGTVSSSARMRIVNDYAGAPITTYGYYDVE